LVFVPAELLGTDGVLLLEWIMTNNRPNATYGEKDLIQRVREMRHGASGISTCQIRMATSCRLLARYSEQRYDGRHFAALETSMIELESVRMKFPEDTNIIVGQTHFIKTAEDMYEAVVNTVPQAKFGLAFNEASGPCLTRAEGNDDELRNAAIANAQAVGAGHVFVLILRNAYPINLLNVVQNIPEVCSIFCATANPVEAIVAKTEQGRGVIGVIDGSPPKGVEGPVEINARKEFLRKIGYKR
jgi:uncharacterized protein